MCSRLVQQVCAVKLFTRHLMLLTTCYCACLLGHTGLGKQSKGQGSGMKVAGRLQDRINECLSMEQIVWCSLGAAACRCACMLMGVAVEELHSCIVTALAGQVCIGLRHVSAGNLHWGPSESQALVTAACTRHLNGTLQSWAGSYCKPMQQVAMDVILAGRAGESLAWVCRTPGEPRPPRL